MEPVFSCCVLNTSYSRKLVTWLRTGAFGVLFEHDNEPSVSVKYGECCDWEPPQWSCLVSTDEDCEPKIRSLPKEYLLKKGRLSPVRWYTCCYEHSANQSFGNSSDCNSRMNNKFMCSCNLLRVDITIFK